MADLSIPDISQFQNDIDWPNFGASAVIVRINYGNVQVDAKADRNIDGARSKCQIRGWYTYLTAGEDPVAQANVMVRVLQAHGGLQPNEFIVCDDEEGTGDQSSRVTAFLNEVDKQLNATDSKDWWYSGLNFSTIHNLYSAIGHRWIAAYGQGEPTVSHDLWQYTDAGTIAGVSGPVDMSIWHGDINSLIQFIGGATGIFMALTDQQQSNLYQNVIRILTFLADGHQSMEDANGNLVDVPATWPEWLRDQINNTQTAIKQITTPTVDINALATQLAADTAFINSLATAIAHTLGGALDKA
jgi:GH25 family lysozyme M1 (1,4-beta-N-acetylmuramidase)